MKTAPDDLPPWLHALGRPVHGMHGAGDAVGSIRTRWLTKGNHGAPGWKSTDEVLIVWQGGSPTSRVGREIVLVMQ